MPHSHVAGLEPGQVPGCPKARREHLLQAEHEFHPHPGVWAAEVNEIEHPPVGGFFGRARGDWHALALDRGSGGIQRSPVRNLPADIFDVLVVAGADCEAVVPLVRPQVHELVTTVGPDFETHDLRAVRTPRGQVTGGGCDVGQLIYRTH